MARHGGDSHPEARLSLPAAMMPFLRTVEKIHDGYFVDLYVRVSNAVAIQMYKVSYVIYRQVIGYYSGTEDGYDMRERYPRPESEVPMTHRVPRGVGVHVTS